MNMSNSIVDRTNCTITLLTYSTDYITLQQYWLQLHYLLLVLITLLTLLYSLFLARREWHSRHSLVYIDTAVQRGILSMLSMKPLWALYWYCLLRSNGGVLSIISFPFGLFANVHEHSNSCYTAFGTCPLYMCTHTRRVILRCLRIIPAVTT